MFLFYIFFFFFFSSRRRHTRYIGDWSSDVCSSPIPLVQDAIRPSRSVDLACRLWALDRQARAAALHRLGLTVLNWDPRESLEAALAGFNRSRRRSVAG